jgi:hypothetical protein
MRPVLIAAALATLVLAGAIPAASAFLSQHSGGERLKDGQLGWAIEAGEKERVNGKVQLTLSRRSSGSEWIHSHTRPLAQLAGLSMAQLGSESGGPVRFRLERDAGAIDCEGVARRFRGTGDCRFTANPAFARELEQRGHGQASEEQLFSLALHNVGRPFLDELGRQGYAKPAVGELVRAADHGATLDYLREMGEAGFRVGTLAELIRMRDHGVSARFARELAEYGIKGLSSGEIVRLRDHGVSASFLGELRTLGYGGLSAEQVVRLRDHGVSASFIRKVNASGGERRSAEELVTLRDRGWTGR